MNHLTNNLDQHLNEHFSDQPDEVTCFFCLEEINEKDVYHLNVIGKRIDCCKECHEFQTSNK